MNIAQALAIAVATYAYALHVQEPWSMRYAILAAEAHAKVTESEAFGRAAFAHTQALLAGALQQGVEQRIYASSSTSQ